MLDLGLISSQDELGHSPSSQAVLPSPEDQLDAVSSFYEKLQTEGIPTRCAALTKFV